jgi:hypothetical protein
VPKRLQKITQYQEYMTTRKLINAQTNIDYILFKYIITVWNKLLNKLKYLISNLDSSEQFILEKTYWALNSISLEMIAQLKVFENLFKNK